MTHLMKAIKMDLGKKVVIIVFYKECIVCFVERNIKWLKQILNLFLLLNWYVHVPSRQWVDSNFAEFWQVNHCSLRSLLLHIHAELYSVEKQSNYDQERSEGGVPGVLGLSNEISTGSSGLVHVHKS